MSSSGTLPIDPAEWPPRADSPEGGDDDLALSLRVGAQSYCVEWQVTADGDTPPSANTPERLHLSRSGGGRAESTSTR